MNNEWLKNIKVGDEVVVKSRHRTSIKRVERLTKTQIVLEGYDTKFRKDTGYAVGQQDSFYFAYIVEATPEVISEIKARNKKTV